MKTLFFAAALTFAFTVSSVLACELNKSKGGGGTTASSSSSGSSSSGTAARQTGVISAGSSSRTVEESARVAREDACDAIATRRKAEAFLAKGDVTPLQRKKLDGIIADADRRLKVNSAQFEEASGSPFSDSSCDGRAIASK